jgi:hypothetical protein
MLPISSCWIASIAIVMLLATCVLRLRRRCYYPLPRLRTENAHHSSRLPTSNTIAFGVKGSNEGYQSNTGARGKTASLKSKGSSVLSSILTCSAKRVCILFQDSLSGSIFTTRESLKGKFGMRAAIAGSRSNECGSCNSIVAYPVLLWRRLGRLFLTQAS